MRRAAPLLLLLLALAACAGAAGTSAVGAANLVGPDQLRELDSEGLTVYQVLSRLRPTWLRSRGQTSIRGGPDIPRAVIDGVPYDDLAELARVNAREVESIEFVSSGDATTLYGTGYAGGAILVTMRR